MNKTYESRFLSSYLAKKMPPACPLLSESHTRTRASFISEKNDNLIKEFNFRFKITALNTAEALGGLIVIGLRSRF